MTLEEAKAHLEAVKLDPKKGVEDKDKTIKALQLVSGAWAKI